MQRRTLLTAATAVPLLLTGRVARPASSDDRTRRLIVILLRGAIDGLSVVVPYAEDAYYKLRRLIAIARPGKPNGALALDDRFGLHPALAGLMPLWNDRQLAFVHAAGSPDPTRSHFDAQLYIETGTPGNDRTPDGWMNRLLQALPGPRHATDAIGVGTTLPRILAGRAPVANLGLGPDAAKSQPIDQPDLGSEFDRLYAGSDTLADTYRAGRAARTRLLADLAAERRAADNGGLPTTGFAARASRLALLLRRDPGIRLAFVGLGGWDTHIDQGGYTGQLAGGLRGLGDGLAALAKGLGDSWADTVVVVLSEFGRTVAENGNGGTDHGHGTAIWIAGGVVQGGRIYGDWPGLTPAALYQRRDLAVTTDFRTVIAIVLERHLQLARDRLHMVLPGAPPAVSGATDILRP